MKKIMTIALLSLVFLLPNCTFAGKHHAKNRHDKHSNRSDSYSRARQGWDISPREAERASNCYYYSMYVEGGRGSARIMSLPEKNYIQISDGQKNGYVCFNGPTTLELGKLSNPNVYVELDIEDVGTFYFEPGNRGSKLINNWYRLYWGL